MVPPSRLLMCLWNEVNTDQSSAKEAVRIMENMMSPPVTNPFLTDRAIRTKIDMQVIRLPPPTVASMLSSVKLDIPAKKIFVIK